MPLGVKGPIGYTVEVFIKAQLDKRHAAREAEAAEAEDVTPHTTQAVPREPEPRPRPKPAAEEVPKTGGLVGPVGYAVQLVKGPLDKGQPAGEDAADGKDGFEAVPLDEEGFGSGASPEKTGVPRDPVNARSKRLASLAVMAIGFGLAIDFSMSLMSIQPLYYIIEGPQNLYGLTFGSYDLTSMLFAPLFGYWTDRTAAFKAQAGWLDAPPTGLPILLGAVVNSAGNLLYGFVYLADRWWVMLVSRAIAGVGAATLGIGSSYITQTTTSARRQVVLGRYRVTQNLARMLGPFVGYLFIGLPNVDQGASTGLKLFNWYTIPGWTAFLLVAVLAAVFACWFVNPSDDNEHLVHAAEELAAPTPERTARFRSFAAWWLLLSFLTIFSFSGYTANLFALFAGQFHAIQTQGDNWRTYIAVGIGAAVGSWLFRRMIGWCPKLWEERKLCLFTNFLLFAAWMLVIPYGGSSSVPSDVLYYISTALTGFTVVINQASLETVFSKKVSQYADVVGPNVGKLLGVYYMAASAGRFAGPLVVAGVTRIATPSGQTNYCTDLVATDTGVSCNGPPAQQCLITGDQYYVEGCTLYNVIPMYAAMAGLHIIIGLGIALVLRKHWSYDNGTSPAAAAAQGAAADKGSVAQ